ncbi:MAG: hypothetical protein ACF8R7_09335 [Phycisphaerales bacterium JB039]
MDEVDHALAEAWDELAARLARDPEEAERRAARAARVLRHPVSAWCIRLRATDTRPANWGVINGADLEAAERGEAHDVHLTKWWIRDLSAPVHLRWPGVDWQVAAAELGRPPATIRQWIRRGVFEVRWDYARSVGKNGQPVPSIWTRAPLDPHAPRARRNPLWGDMWPDLFDRLPDDYAITLRREPHPDPASIVQRGYFYRCPGRYLPLPEGLSPPTLAPPGGERMSAQRTGEGSQQPASEASAPPSLHIPCNRLVRVLFLPFPCWTIADFRGAPDHIPQLKPQWSDLTGQLPACERCWNVQRDRPLDGYQGAAGWNLFVTQLTGGLLTGSEVRRPLDLVPREDRPPVTTFVRKPALRAAIFRMLLEAAPHRQIAATLGISRKSIEHHARQIYRQHGVRNAIELRAKLGAPPPTPEQRTARAAG